MAPSTPKRGHGAVGILIRSMPKSSTTGTPSLPAQVWYGSRRSFGCSGFGCSVRGLFIMRLVGWARRGGLKSIVTPSGLIAEVRFAALCAASRLGNMETEEFRREHQRQRRHGVSRAGGHGLPVEGHDHRLGGRQDLFERLGGGPFLHLVGAAARAP